MDEIGELPMAAQVRLLRVLQNNEIERVGGAEVIPTNVRIVAATHRTLEELIRKGRFREDLWYPLNVFPILIPPLRNRSQDIPALTHHFIELCTTRMRLGAAPQLAEGTLDRLRAYHWPGNVPGRYSCGLLAERLALYLCAGTNSEVCHHGSRR